MKALCIVAHPDDCVIFALSYIHNHPEHDWTIGYLTYTDSDPRGAELSAFWQRRGIGTVFLGFEDWWEDDVHKQFTRWRSEHAAEACWNLAQDYDLILTHDADGDYGHIHHQLVHDAVARHYNMVTFAPHNQGTVTLTVPPGTYTLDELPMHGDIIQSFHIEQHRNSYKEPQ